MSLYTLRTSNGVEMGPLSLAQVEVLVQQGKVGPSSMIFTQTTNLWHLAAALPEVRALLQLHQPNSITAISRVRVIDHGIVHRPSRSRMISSAPRACSASRPDAGDAAGASAAPAVPESGIELYTIRASDGVEYGPSTLEQVKELAKQGRLKATTMVFTRSSNRWHLAASVPEIRLLLREYNPSQDSTLNRIRAQGTKVHDSAHALMAQGRISTIRVKHPFWKRLFGR